MAVDGNVYEVDDSARLMADRDGLRAEVDNLVKSTCGGRARRHRRGPLSRSGRLNSPGSK